MPRVVYDTSSFISHRPTYYPAGFLMSAVVIQELTAGAGDKSEVQYWERAWQAHEKAGTLLVPTGADWWFSGKVLNSLLRGLKSHAGGRTPKLAPQEKQRIIRDVLIARTVKRAGALLVTDNMKDFLAIRRFCAIRVARAADYFR